MSQDPLALAEKTALLLGLAAAAACGLAWGPRAGLAAFVGAAVATANVRATRSLSRRAVAATADGGADPSGVAGRLLIILFIKMIALFALVWLAVSVAHLEVLPLGLGLAVIVPALLFGGLRFARLAPGANPGQTNTDIEKT